MTTSDTIKSLQSMLLSPDRSIQAVAATIATPEQFEQALLGLGIESFRVKEAQWLNWISWSHQLGGNYILLIFVYIKNGQYAIGLDMSKGLATVVELYKPLRFTDLKADIRTISDALTQFCAAVQNHFRS